MRRVKTKGSFNHKALNIQIGEVNEWLRRVKTKGSFNHKALNIQIGEVTEWLKEPAWKASVPQKGTGGSNPPLSAKDK